MFNSINLLDIGHMSSLITDSEHLSQSRLCSGHYEQLYHSLLGERRVTPPSHETRMTSISQDVHIA